MARLSKGRCRSTGKLIALIAKRYRMTHFDASNELADIQQYWRLYNLPAKPQTSVELMGALLHLESLGKDHIEKYS